MATITKDAIVCPNALLNRIISALECAIEDQNRLLMCGGVLSKVFRARVKENQLIVKAIRNRQAHWPLR